MKRLLNWIAALAIIITPLAFAIPANALTVKWNPDGNYKIDFVLGGDNFYDATISGFSAGHFNISGNYPSGGPYTYAWNGTGTVSGNTITDGVDYTATPDALGTHMDMTGTIAPNGTMSGTWTDNYRGGSRSGTWATTSGAAVASKIKDFNLDENLDSSQCGVTKKSKEVVDVKYKLVNDYDSGIGGNAWANDTINRELNIWNTGDGHFCAIVSDNGTIVTFAGESPNGSGTVATGVKGVMDGGYRTTFSGSFLGDGSTYHTHGNLGTFNLACTDAYNCPGPHPSINSYTSGWDGSTLDWWGWQYNTCQNGNWVNSVDGNFGDITGSVSSQNNKECRCPQNRDKDDGGHHNDGHHDKKHWGVKV